MDIEQNIDPGLRAGFTQIPESDNDISDWVEARKNQSEKMAAAQAGHPKSDKVAIENRNIPGPAGSPEVPVRIYTPSVKKSGMSGLLYIHGGGFTRGDRLQDFDSRCERIVEGVGCVLVSVGYRLAPENPFPAGVEDCYAALCWMASSAAYLGVDTTRIAVGGSSAGGGLAAATALMARDRKEVTLAFQWLFWGCIDDRHITPSSYEITDRRVWNRAKSINGWKAYLGSAYQGEVSPYAAPARMENLSGLPSAYIIVGELDILRDENIDYATRLMQAGIPAELHVIPGAFHGFTWEVPNAEVSIRTISESNAALKRALSH